MIENRLRVFVLMAVTLLIASIATGCIFRPLPYNGGPDDYSGEDTEPTVPGTDTEPPATVPDDQMPQDDEIPPAEQPSVPTVYLQSGGSYRVGQEVKMDVYARDMPDFSGAQISITYDPAILRYNRAVEGTFLNSNSETFFFTINTSAVPGVVKDVVIVRRTGNIMGEGLIASVYFTAIGRGSTNLGFTESMLTNAAAESVPASFSGTSLTVN